METLNKEKTLDRFSLGDPWYPVEHVIPFVATEEKAISGRESGN